QTCRAARDDPGGHGASPSVQTMRGASFADAPHTTRYHAARVRPQTDALARSRPALDAVLRLQPRRAQVRDELADAVRPRSQLLGGSDRADEAAQARVRDRHDVAVPVREAVAR